MKGEGPAQQTDTLHRCLSGDHQGPRRQMGVFWQVCDQGFRIRFQERLDRIRNRVACVYCGTKCGHVLART